MKQLWEVIIILKGLSVKASGWEKSQTFQK